MRGQPLVFLAIVVGTWAGARSFALWPVVARAVLAPIAGVPAAVAVVPEVLGFAPAPKVRAKRSSAKRIVRTDPTNAEPVIPAVAPFVGDPTEGDAVPGSAAGQNTAMPVGLPMAPTMADTRRADAAQSLPRWSGSAWAIGRAGGGGAVPSPLLGGSQAGARFVYALDPARGWGLFGRVASPLASGPGEVAIGLQWRPRARGPVTAFVEARLLDGRVSPTVGAYGGGAVELGQFRLDGFGQAGVIHRDGALGFADGQVRLTRPIGRVDIGLGVWAAAQRGANRVDVGPTVAWLLPMERPNLRVTLDWRQRVAGNARPASGPALSLGADF